MLTHTPAGDTTGLRLAEKVIQHVTLTDKALSKAAAFEKAAAARDQKVAALIPKVVDTMVQFERISPNEREKLASLLKDPVKVLELMIKVAGHRNVDELSRLGAPAGQGQTKQANANPANSLTNPFVGARTTTVKQSSVSLFKGLGLPAPTE